VSARLQEPATIAWRAGDAVADQHRGGASTPSGPVSIIVPVHGRAALTERCLDMLLAELPAGCELIVVDDASPDSTPALLASYGEAIRVLTLPRNAGYARACNEGAAVAAHDVLVFLNNDTEPQGGWLYALGRYARAHPDAAIVGAKLLYPTGTVQHAGVAIGQDGYPHNLYGGLSGEHPAVNRSRRLQAVTGACMLVRRAAFERAGGFDTAYVNSLEDVDLCLRIGQIGGEVHYCHEASLIHLESASRGREDRFERSVARYRERWRDCVRRDDLSIYAEDGLLEVEYRDSYPQRMSISPRLAIVDSGREQEIESLLEAYAGQVSGLLAEVMRLTAIAGSPTRTPAPTPTPAPESPPSPAAGAIDHRAFLAEANRLEEQARGLQQRLQDAQDAPASDSRSAFSANRRLGYRRLADRVCAAVADAVPPGSSVLVVSRGDRELVRLAECEARHFPQDPGGGYLGHHPRDSKDAIERLENLRAAGAEFLVLPSISYWWLEHYQGFAEHLRRRYPVTDLDVCSIYRLDASDSRVVPEVGA
jgi:GT2 family glycosyltransferase